MATVLLTGAGGFVVRHVAAALAERGARVLLVDKWFDPDVVAAWRSRDAALLNCDAEALARHVDEPVDAVVHGAAVTAEPAELGWSPEAYLQAELDAALAVWRWADAAGVGRRVFISSAGVFAGDEADELDEMVAPRPRGHYGLAKYLIERVVSALREFDGRDACSLRLGDVFGPAERARTTRPRVSLLQSMLDAARQGGTVHAHVPSAARAWSYAPDIGAALHTLLQAPRLRHGLYHLASPERFDEQGLATELVALVPGARLQTIAADPAQVRARGLFATPRFDAEFPRHRWTPFRSALEAVVAQAGVTA